MRKAAILPARRKHHARLLPYLFIFPAVTLIVVCLGRAVYNVLYFSLQHYNANKPYANGFAGLDNFIRLFTQDRLFYQALWMSLKWVVSEVALQLLFGLILALVLNQRYRLRGLTRTIVFSPWAISGMITSVMWGLMLNEQIGIVNDLLIRLGITAKNIAWLGNSKTVFPSLVVAELWRGIPFFAIMLLAALQAIPLELYESAHIDGAGMWGRFRHVTLPYLKDTIVLATLLRGVWEFNNVDLIFNMTGGGPANSTTTLSMYVVRQAINSNNFGYGSAIAVVGFVILVIFSIVYLRVSGFSKEEG